VTRPDAATVVGLILLATAVVALVSWVFQITDTFVAATCGPAPTRNFASIDAYIDFLHCQDATENRYWMVMAVALGAGMGYTARAWLRREARRDVANDEKLDAEIARIRGQADSRHDA